MIVQRHAYFNASDNPGQYAADECDRQAITIAALWAEDRLIDYPVWRYSKESDDMGLDAWRMIQSMDRWSPGCAPDPSKPFLIGDTSVGPDHVVYVQKRDLNKLGIPVPESVWEEFRRTRDYRLARSQRVILPKE